MLVVAVVLFLVWVLAVVSSLTMGGVAHLLLAGALALVAARLVQFRRGHHRMSEHP